jgi:hypothetical protein
MNNIIKKIGIGLVSVTSLIVLTGLFPTGASAQYMPINRPRSHVTVMKHDQGLTGLHRTRTNRDFGINFVTVKTDRAFFNREGLFGRHPIFNYYLHDQIYARQIVLVDQLYPTDVIVINNSNTGAYSVNVIRVVVDHDFFNQVSSDISVNQNITLSVDTGNNSVSYNTGSGDIETGDVSLMVN